MEPSAGLIRCRSGSAKNAANLLETVISLNN